MKKTAVIVCLAVVALSNNHSFSQRQTKKPAASKTTQAKAASATKKSSSSAADVEEGKNLIAKSDCLACHQLKVKVVGPAYNAVAEKYAASDANVKKLSGKIIKGGSGVWGPIAMTPHPAISPADADKMVEYILSLRSK